MDTLLLKSHKSNAPQQRGVTLIELMIGMVISLFVVLALATLFVNSSRSNAEMAKTNDLIDNGRIALQLLSEDLIHAGFLGGYVPRFDDMTFADIPPDAPTDIPNPCEAFTGWSATYRTNLLAIPVESRDSLFSGTGCLSPATLRANNDALVVRHADTCVPGEGNCEANTVGNLYFQFPRCQAEKQETAQGAAADSIVLANSLSTTDGAYKGAAIRTISGPGAGQIRLVTAYDGASRTATVSPNWVATPNHTTTYSLDYVLGTNAYPLHLKNCTTVSEKRRFISNIYYVTDVTQDGQTIPTLMRAQLNLAGGVIAHQAPVPLIDGVEVLRVYLGIDDLSETAQPVDFTAAVDWADPATKVTTTNRGDGVPDRFVRCTTAAACDVSDLSNVVAVKLFVLARSSTTSAGHTDAKTYCLGEPQSDGSCATADTIGPMNDGYKRHLFTTSVRINNVSARRETP
jgi:prepilin-type N-terminal cleavage/methylation domain-containing protein